MVARSTHVDNNHKRVVPAPLGRRSIWRVNLRKRSVQWPDAAYAGLSASTLTDVAGAGVRSDGARHMLVHSNFGPSFIACRTSPQRSRRLRIEHDTTSFRHSF